MGVKKISDKTKIRKLRILSKKFDLVNEIDNIIASSDSSNPEFKLFFWQISKFCNNYITNNTPNSESILREIIIVC